MKRMQENFTMSQTNRRQLLKSAGAAVAGAMAFPYIVPSSVLGKDGAVAPSNRVTMGWIGTGGQGRGLIGIFMGMKQVQVLACSDVDDTHVADGVGQANEHYGNDACVGFHDFREMLQRKDIDACVVATPDHWHALASVAALNAGKDVYCEKPLANSIWEGRQIVEAVKRNNRVLQTGSMERSNPSCRYACELVHSGAIGKLHTIHINLPDEDGHLNDAKQTKDSAADSPIPKELDWDFWLGHAPKVAFRKPSRPNMQNFPHFWWRFILTYGGGEMTDRGAHVIDIAQMGNKTDETGPVEIEAKGRQSPGSVYSSFWDYSFTNTFENGVKMIGGTKNPRGLKFEGDKGWIFVHIHGGKLEASDPTILTTEIDDKFKLGRAPGAETGHDTNGHRRQFIEAISTRKQPFANAEVGHRSASICHLNNIAMALGRKLKWDPKAEQFIGDDEANKMARPVMRSPWVL
jgi:predicted dehydrogenase